MANVQDAAGQSYLRELAQHAAQALPGHKLVPIDVNGNGNFPYNYLDSNATFTYDTWQYLNHSVVSAGDGEVAFSDPLTNVYESLVGKLSYQFSADDTARMNKAQIEAGQLTTAVVHQYEDIYGKIADSQLSSAQVDTKIDYILMYKLRQWASPNVLDLSTDAIKNLSDKLPNLPSSAKPLLPVISQCLGSMSDVLGLINIKGNALGELKDLRTNISSPSAANGGLETNDHKYHPGFKINSSMEDIDSGIGSDRNAFTINIRVDSYSHEQAQVSVQQGASSSVSLLGLIRITTSEGTAYTLYDMNSEGSHCEIRATYRGVTGVPFMPTEYQVDSRSGWFEHRPLREAVANYDKAARRNKDVTGFVFSPYPQADELTTLCFLAISRLPDIEIEFFDGTASAHMMTLQQRSDVKVNVFGIMLGNASRQYNVSNVRQSSSGKGFVVSFSAPPPAGGAIDQRAVVLGGELLMI